jgi:C4-dicarboxylate-specific signal transduction histidine kinase
LRDVESCSESATEIIRGVRDLLQKKPRPFKPLDLNHVVRGVIEVLRSDLILRQVSLVTHLDAARSEIVGDSAQLRQVVLNLFVNALEAMTERDSTERRLVVLTLDRPREIELQVSDRGTGIDPANIEEMFKPFFTTKEQGTGMGLHICSEIVRSHGGRLRASNNIDGPGLTVSCLLPVSGIPSGFEPAY